MAAGLSDVAVEVPTPYDAVSADEWGKRSSPIAGRFAQKIAAVPPPAAETLRARARESVRPYETPTAVHIPGVILVAVGRRT